MKPAQVQLRPAATSDLDAILAIERATDTAPHWPHAAYTEILGATDPARCLIVAHTDEVVAGFAVGVLHATTDSERIAELESIAVAAGARRYGIGRALCAAVIDWCRSQGATEVVLEVRADSIGAIALYVALGFSHAGRRPKYYSDPEDDALLMRRVLN
jgi:ribosomal-protein-alanine acetyltransferase